MTAAAAADPATCPKCGHKRPAGVEACARCGLVFALWTPEKAAEVVKLDEAGEAAWAALIGRWQDEAQHDAFLKRCAAGGTLAAAGRCYRAYLDQHPGDALATKMQERIVVMATLTFARPTRPPTPVTRSRWFWAVVGLAVSAGVVLALLFGRR